MAVLPDVRCAWCDEVAERTIRVRTQTGSYRIDACATHLEHVLAGARQIPPAEPDVQGAPTG